MKKLTLIITLCFLLLCITACGNTDRNHATVGNGIEFAGVEDMLTHMDGMWATDDNLGEKSYYIFQDGQIYVTTDTRYSEQIKYMLDSALQKSGLESLYVQNFTTTPKRIYLSDLSIIPDPVTLFPQTGEIKLYEGTYKEESIIITEESVLLVNDDAKTGTVMTKISDTVDFSIEHFEPLFNQVLNSYQIPSSHFLMTPAEYGEMIKTTIPQFDWWSQTWSDDDLEVYAPDEALTPVAGSSLLISKESLTFAYKVSVSTGFIGKNHTQSLVITYSPEEGSIQVLETNNPSMNLYSLIKYGLYAIQNIPEAYTDPIELANDMDAKGRKDSSDYSSEIVMTANGITYELSTTEAGSATLGEFNIKVNGAISLNTILEGATESTNPAESGNISSNSNSSDNAQSSGSATEPTADTQAPTETEPTATESATKDKLNFSFSDPSCFSTPLTIEWEIPYHCEYAANYLFEEDGTCYMLLGAPFDVVCKGIGTYSVDGDTVTFHIILDDGTEIEYTYLFNFDAGTVTQLSEEGFAFYHERNDVFKLTEAKDLSLDIYKEAFPSAEDIG